MADALSSPNEFGVEDALGSLREACLMAKLESMDAQLIRLGENALFRLADGRTVVRIARTMAYWQDVQNEVNVAGWLASQKFPAAEVSDIQQPIVAGGRPVTFWKYIAGRAGARADIQSLGLVLRALHSLARPTNFTLPEEDILGRVGSRVELASVATSDKDFLFSRLESVEGAVAGLHFPLAPAATHGDAHTENLIIRGDQPVLIDFERFAWGQPEWDLAMTATEFVTAGWWTPDEYQRFCDAYGYDVMDWREGFPILQAVHEIKMTTWLMQNVRVSKDIADEYEVRMKAIRGQDRMAPWRPF